MRRHIGSALVITLLVAGCGTTADDAGGVQASLTVTSDDFANGTELPAWATANALGGQCTGDNTNPELTWESPSAATEGFALTLIDPDAHNFVHWMLADIPASTTAIARGGSDAVSGVGGKSSLSSTYDGTYFGPCPPGPDHHYVFTLYALDAPLNLEQGFSLADLKDAMRGHVLAEGALTGLRSGPA
ncbi:YbhB/YbcL family Raf kinase inhibitor-like protein [Demequina lutea]|uniref:Phospholipid-binding protein, PBP family n=1 Tax=Demequina lutea TaxID=431489 RepID=A0A7Z0CK80_9MICO|nr:YbhB/YbcL family Raf kinase inhibitor-like protein [Demequina lutea]NYI41623.1 hypothetical protein [Demequina lutea]